MVYHPREGATYVTVNGVTYNASYRFSDQTVIISIEDENNPDPSLFVWNEQYRRWVARL